MCRFGEIKVRILRMAVVNAKWLRLVEDAPSGVKCVFFVKRKGKSKSRIDRCFSRQSKILCVDTCIKHEVACRPPIPVYKSHHLARCAGFLQREERRVRPGAWYVVLIECVIE